MSKMTGSISEIGFHGTPAVLLETAGGASAVVSLLGGQVLSWQPASGKEWLYLSPQAVMGGGQAIRGGIPVCFPQFSTLGSLPRHGFARTAVWKLGERREEDQVMVTLTLEDDAARRAIWPHRFQAELTILLADERLDVELAVENRGAESFDFTAALHTYLRVSDIEDVKISGLRGLGYRDAAAGNQLRQERGDVVMIRGEVDRVYRDASAALMLSEPERDLGVHAENFADVVLWNPGAEICTGIADLPADAWRQFVCVEAGAIERAVTLTGGESWWGRQTLLDLATARANVIE